MANEHDENHRRMTEGAAIRVADLAARIEAISANYVQLRVDHSTLVKDFAESHRTQWQPILTAAGLAVAAASVAVGIMTVIGTLAKSPIDSRLNSLEAADIRHDRLFDELSTKRVPREEVVERIGNAVARIDKDIARIDDDLKEHKQVDRGRDERDREADRARIIELERLIQHPPANEVPAAKR